MKRRRLLVGGATYLMFRPLISFAQGNAEEFKLPEIFIMSQKVQGSFPGGRQDLFRPNMVDGNLVMNEYFKGLVGLEKYTTIMTGIGIPYWLSPNIGTDSHHTSVIMYSGSPYSIDTGGDREMVNGRATHETLDHFVAKSFNSQVICTDFTGKNLGGGGAQYVSNVADGNQINRFPPSTNATGAFERMFQNFAGGAGIGADYYAQMLKRNKSIFDLIDGFDCQRVKNFLPQEKQTAVEEYCTKYRELEQAQSNAMAPNVQCSAQDLGANWDSDNPNNIVNRANRIADMMAFAGKCGLHRVFVFAAADSNDGNMNPRAFDPALPDTHYHFGVWHNEDRRTPEQHRDIEATMFEKTFGYLAQKFASTDLGGGKNLLDATLMLYSSNMSSNHSIADHPFVLIGGANGRHTGNLSIDLSGRNHTSNEVFLTTLQKLGIQASKFGSDTSKDHKVIPGI